MGIKWVPAKRSGRIELERRPLELLFLFVLGTATACENSRGGD